MSERITLAELLDAGYSYNPNLWIGNAHFYCPVCKQHTTHKALSRKAEDWRINDKLVCNNCMTADKNYPLPWNEVNNGSTNTK